jgi:hypothetical protein
MWVEFIMFKPKVQAPSRAHTTSYLLDAGGSFFRAKVAWVRLITYFPLVLRSRMDGAIPLLLSLFSWRLQWRIYSYLFLIYLNRAAVRGKAEAVNRYSVPCSYRIRVHTFHMKNFKALYKTSVGSEACTFVCECNVLDRYQRFGGTSCLQGFRFTLNLGT